MGGTLGESSLTFEVALYIGALAFGLLVRLVVLDARPLTLEEGSLAGQAHRLMMGQLGESFVDGPLQTYGTALSLSLFAGGDGAARLPSVLFGLVLVGAPYLLRRTLGQTAALLASYLLAFSPVLLFASRTVGSGVVPAALSLLLWWTASEGSVRAGWRPFGIALVAAALLASGPSGITVLLTLGLAAFLAHPDPRGFILDARSAFDSPTWRRAALLFIGAALTMGAGLGFNLNGIQSILVDGWAGWLASINLLAPRGGLLYILALYELPVLLLALVGLGGTLLRRDRTDMMLSLWAMLLLLVGMMQPAAGTARFVLPMVPLYLLAGRTLAGSLPMAKAVIFSWRWVTGVVIVVTPVLVAMVFLNRSSILVQEIPQEFLYAEIALVVVAVAGLVIVVPGQQRTSLLWYVFVFGAAAFWLHTAVFLNYRQESAPSEILAGQQVSPQLRQAALDAAYYSANYNAPVAIDPQLRPYLEWYLRNARGIDFSQTNTQGIGISLAQGSPGMPPAGAERVPGVYSPTVEGQGLSWQGVWSWAMTRGGMVRQNPRDIILRTPLSIW